MNLRISNVTILYVYLEWDKVPQAIGYWLFKDNQRVSWIGNPDQTTTRFLKPLFGSVMYGVMAILPGIRGEVHYPVGQAVKADPLMPLRGGNSG